MIAIQRFVLLLSCSLSAYAIFAQDSWIVYNSSTQNGFSIEVPAEMEVRSKMVHTALGELTTKAYTYEGATEDKNKLYMVNEVEYPHGTFPADSLSLVKEYLHEAIKTAARNMSGEVVYTNEVKIDGAIGFLFRIKYNDGKAIVKGKATIFRDTFYMMKVYAHKDDSLNEEMNLFLNSFRFSS